MKFFFLFSYAYEDANVAAFPLGILLLALYFAYYFGRKKYRKWAIWDNLRKIQALPQAVYRSLLEAKVNKHVSQTFYKEVMSYLFKVADHLYTEKKLNPALRRRPSVPEDHEGAYVPVSNKEEELRLAFKKSPWYNSSEDLYKQAKTAKVTPEYSTYKTATFALVRSTLVEVANKHKIAISEDLLAQLLAKLDQDFTVDYALDSEGKTSEEVVAELFAATKDSYKQK